MRRLAAFGGVLGLMLALSGALEARAFQFRDVVGIEVRNNVQPMQRNRGSSGLAIKNCRDVVVTGNHFHYGKAPILSLGGNVSVTQSGNLVGNPLRLFAATAFAGPA